MSSSLLGVVVSGCGPDKIGVAEPSALMDDLVGTLQDTVAEATRGTPILISGKVSAMSLMLKAIKEGIHKTMDLSTKTLPIALLVLALQTGNLRL